MYALNLHAEVLYILNGLAPSGYPDPYSLRDALLTLDYFYGIFKPDGSEEHKMSLNNRAILVTDRWRIMTKHGLMLKKAA